ncbi:WD40 domain-containing protein [Caligus rogercresseyi]|uniref:WD40 domain-containing protein n=1 Tax=Caligus rogercresseyi TaxID=217165 RepID=A0A7T8GL78_CALRO|nr:WD40 domain-containing protein [Caligus rogercresseyi]
MESEEVLLKGISHSEGLSPCSLFPHERNSLQPLPLSLSCRETGFKSGQSLRELLAESRFVDKVDMESTPCRCSLSGSTKSAFITVFSSDASYMASTHGDHNLYVTRLKERIKER